MSKPTVLMILDGWGVNEPYLGNAVHRANTPYFDKLISEYRTTVLRASEASVGLPAGVFGNSEVGHTTLGAGRVFYQDLLRIDQAIADGEFFNNPSFQRAIDHVVKNNSQLHLMGLVSDGCVHSSNQHLFALLELAKRHNLQQVFVHVFLDGRDTPYNSGINYVTELEAKL